MRNWDVEEMLLVYPMQTRGVDKNKSSGKTSYISSLRHPWTINKVRGVIRSESIRWNWSFHWITTNVRLFFSRCSRVDLFHGKKGGNYLKLNGRVDACPRQPLPTPHNPKGIWLPVAEKAQSPPLEVAGCCALALKVGLNYGLDVGPLADNTTNMSDLWNVIHDKYRSGLICISIGIEKTKKYSRDDDLDAEAHICRLIRGTEDLRDGKGKGTWHKNGASSSPLPSPLYSHSEIAMDAVTYHPGYRERP